MKKTVTLILSMLFLLLSTTSCGLSSTINYDGRYWYIDSTATYDIYEQITYDVKVVSRTESNSTEIKNANLSFALDSGTYVTTLTKDGDNYIYQTSLNVNGNYVYGDKTEPVNNDLQTVAVFNAIDFKPVFSEKKSNLTTTMTGMNNYYEPINYSYDYRVNYNGKHAETIYNFKLSTDATATTVSNTYKNYNDNAYIDNELLTFMPRAINFNNKESYTLSFNTIDVITQKMHDLALTTVSNSVNLDVKTFTFTYDNVVNNTPIVYPENKIQVVKVLLMIDDTFSGGTIELYYAMDHETHRHRLIKAYTPLNHEMGYMEYTIKSVVLNTNTNN